MNDELDAIAVATGTVAVAGGAYLLDLNIILPIVVGSIVVSALIYRRKHRKDRFPRTKGKQ